LRYHFDQLEYLYIHWPFCPYKCHFCDFVAMASHEQFMKDYHQSLCNEIHLFHKEHKRFTNTLKTIYMGGGTPSTYPAHLLLDMFDTLKEYYHFDHTTEVTIEVNPGTLTEGLLQVWKKVGINRLSIGVQSLKDQVLKSLNRHQTVKDVHNLLNEASVYFDNISVDFILGLPGISDDEWKAMIQEAMTWPIKHISIYFLMVHEDTPLYFKVKSNKVSLPPDDAMVDLYDWTVDILSAHGFKRYELSNFARAGYESRHNQAYWDRKSYKGFGLGACSFNGKARFQNDKNLGKYIDNITQGKASVMMSEELTGQQVAREKIMLGLRCHKGLDVIEYTKTISEKEKRVFLDEVEKLQQAKLIDYTENKVRLTPRGFALENEVAIRLFP